eukprot:3163355-Karenia_brevis.AAC.1
MINSIDPSQRQVVFKGFPESMDAERRVQLIETLLKAHSLRFNLVDHFYYGAKNDRKLSRASFAEFSSPESAKNALKKLGGKNKKLVLSDSTEITIKPALSKINQKRNWSL